MSQSKPILASLCIVALGFSGYEAYRVHEVELQLNSAKDESTQQEKKAVVVDARVRELQEQLERLNARTENLGKFLDQLSTVAAAGNQGAENQPATKPDNGPPVPANTVMATRLITPISADELQHRIELALERTPETLTPVTTADLSNMPTSYEWGDGNDRRMWRLVDAGTYEEVYSDGSYSVFPILGRATVNGSPGVITTKDDGTLDVFIPDKGGRMVHLLRGASPGSQWMDYQTMQNVE
jgi:hypothetical protein